MASTFYIGQRLSSESRPCTVRYIGEVQGTKGEWLGVEWDDPARGKHSGDHHGFRYFECKVPGAGSFVRPNRPYDRPNTFLEGLKEKYITNLEASGIPKPIVFGSKVAEEVGFEKVSRKFSELDTLTRVILDYMCVKTCDDDAEEITSTSPTNVSYDQPKLFRVVNSFPNVTDLSIAVGDLTKFSPTISPRILDLQAANGLVSLCLEENAFESVSDLTDLQDLPNLRRLLVARNRIKTVYTSVASEASDKLSFSTITFLDISRNEVSDWKFLDDIRDAFPNLEALRTSQNPLYGTDGNRILSEEAFQITVARLDRKVTSLNYSVVRQKTNNDPRMARVPTSQLPNNSA
ncbi:hypothetical protein ABW21_db0207701 [Orbilia brochopaga]|nr:hypothetical protein ABW21_db0207701 [Drechslerella brochopaga]